MRDDEGMKTILEQQDAGIAFALREIADVDKSARAQLENAKFEMSNELKRELQTEIETCLMLEKRISANYLKESGSEVKTGDDFRLLVDLRKS